MFEIMVWTGAAISLLGLAGLIWCILRVARARRRTKGDDAALHAALRAVLPLNMAALFLSVIGLILVAVGVILS